MTISSTRRGFALLLLYVISMGLSSCGTSPDVSKGTENVPTASKSPEKDDPCKNTTATDRASKIEKYLNQHSMRDEELNDQRYNGNFGFSVVPYYKEGDTGPELKILVRVYGRVIGHDGDDYSKPPKMKNFLTFLEKGMRAGCIDRASFELNPPPVEGTPQTTNPATTNSDVVGFEWQACPHPEFPCQPDGHCSTNNGECKRDTKPVESPKPTASPTTSPSP